MGVANVRVQKEIKYGNGLEQGLPNNSGQEITFPKSTDISDPHSQNFISGFFCDWLSE